MKQIVSISFIIAGLIAMLVFELSTLAMCRQDQAQSVEEERSPRFEDGKFHSAIETLDMSLSDYVSISWHFLFRKNNRTPDVLLPQMPVDMSLFDPGSKEQLHVTWLGHSSLMIHIDGYNILADPVFEKQVAVFGPARFNGDVPLDIDQVPPIDAVVISHDHYDHLNKYSIRQLNPKTKMFFVPLAVGARLVKWGVPADKIIELDWWEEAPFDNHLTFAATPAQHFSGRGAFDRDKTLWASWVIKTPAHRLFFSGDSGYFDGFKTIGEKYGPFDMTFVECGAYNEAWPDVHSFPEETVQAPERHSSPDTLGDV